MTVVDFEEFTRNVYSKSIYRTLKSIVEAKDIKGSFLEMNYKSQKEFEQHLREMAEIVSYNYIKLLKKKGFPDTEISESDQEDLLREVINEFLSKEISSSN